MATTTEPAVSVDPTLKKVHVNGKTVPLGPNEYQLVEELAMTPHTGVSWRDLAASLSTIRGPVTTLQVKATATSTRRKLREAGINRPLPEIAGVGVRLAP